jgi:exopolyphosphatase/guanosine-5'-triphosphate,3'-diphosphate pyrophosphatase
MRRVAIIDLGTNSVRFDIHALGPGGQREIVHREKLMVRLGERAFQTGRLDATAMARTLEAMTYFKNVCRELSVDHVIAFATSAIRDSSNGRAFVAKVKARTGIEIDVINGDQEARLIASGILNHETPPKGKFALVDIGGGSTEISICEGRKVLVSASFKLGTARLQEVYLKQSPPTRQAIAEMRSEIWAVLSAKIAAEKWPRARMLIGSSGTVKAYVRLLRRHRGRHQGKSDKLGVMSRKKLGQWVKRLSKLSVEEMLKIPGLEAKRADMILSGGILLEVCMDILGVKRVRSTDFSLRDGMMDALSRAHLIPHATEKPLVSMPALHKWVRTIAPGANSQWLAHARRVEKNCRVLERQLPQTKRLSARDLHRLQIAALLHDLGRLVDPVRHAVHGFYMIQNIAVLGGTPEDGEWISHLVLHHSQEKPDLSILDFLESESERREFAKSLAILQIADALDRTRRRAESRATLTTRSLQMRLRLKDSGPVERFRVEQKKSWWEWAFKTSLVLETLSSNRAR